MATSVEPRTSEQYVDFDEYIDFQLQKTRANIKWTDILTAGAGVATLVLGYVLLFTVLDHWVVAGGFGYVTRTVMLLGLLFVTAGWLGWKVVLPYLRSVNRLFAARVIEQSEPGLKGTLFNLIDLERSRRQVPEPVRTTLEKRAAVSLSHMDVDQAVDRRRLMWVSYSLLAVVVLCCLYTIFSPKRISFRRLFLPAADVPVATRTEILDVQPGDVEVLARSEVEVVADVHGNVPEEVTLLYTTVDRRFVDQPVHMRPLEDDAKRFRALMSGENGRGILQDMTYRIVAGDAESRDFHIEVIQPPSARVDEVRYEYPRYMDLPPKTESFGHIDAWEGTQVTLKATANMPVRSARVVFSDTQDTSQRAEELPMHVAGGTKLRAEWTLSLRSDGTFPHFYRIECKNEHGDTDPEPTLYQLTIRPDEPPHIELLDPVRDLEVPANAVVPLLIQARDPDFLLRSVTLRIEKDAEPFRDEEIWEGHQPAFRTSFDWQLARLDLKPGDTISYWLQARDNKQPQANCKNTPKLEIHILDAAPQDEVEKQRLADKQRQQDMLETAEKQLNQDGTSQPEAQQQGGDEGVGPGEQPQQKTDDEKPQSPKTADGQSGESSPDQKDKQQSGEEQGDSGKEQFRNTGADDQEILEKLIRRMQQERKQNEAQDGAEPDEKQQPGREQPQQKQQAPDQEPNGRPDEQRPENRAQKSAADQQPESPQDGAEQPRDGQKSESAAKGEGQQQGDAQEGQAKGQPGKGDDTSSLPASPLSARDTTSKTSKPGKNGKQSDQPLKGDREPAPESPDAKRQKATGQETGEGTPDRDPNANPTPAQNDVQRKPGEQPVKRQRPAQPPESPTDNGASPNPGEAKPAPNTKTSQPPNSNAKQKPSTPSDAAQDRPSPPRGGQPNSDNEELKGAGRPQGQRSRQPQGGEGGSSKQNDQGSPGGNQKGAGDSSQQPGGAEQSDQPTEGQAGGGKGDASKSQGGEKSGGESSKESGDGGADSQSASEGNGKGEGDATGDGTAASSSEQAKQQPGGGGGAGTTGGGGDRSGTSRGGQPGQAASPGEGGGEAAAAEQANLEYAQKAANLVLKRLEDDLERGKVDEKLLKELGWTQDDLKKFADRMRSQLEDRGEDDSPQSQARRRQFEEMLKSLDLTSKSRERRGSEVGGRSPGEGVGPRRLPVPVEYREAFEAYTRGLSKRSNARSNDSQD